LVHKVSAVVLHTALKAVLAIGGSEGVVVVLSWFTKSALLFSHCAKSCSGYRWL